MMNLSFPFGIAALALVWMGVGCGAAATGGVKESRIPLEWYTQVEVSTPGGVKFVAIPPGEFIMGSPESEPRRKQDETQTRVTITRPFLIGVTAVTVDQFAIFTQATGYQTVAEREGWSHVYTEAGIEEHLGISWKNPGFLQEGDHPVVCVNWEDIQAYLSWFRAETGLAARLPSEAEWEYVCRAGTTTAYFWGEFSALGSSHANLGDLAAARVYTEWASDIYQFDDGFVHTSPVGHFAPNSWGVHDMHGNVWEWTGDWYGGPLPGVSLVDPVGADSGEYRVRRGGSWYRGYGTARSANRGRSEPDFRVSNRGFRMVVEVDDAPFKHRIDKDQPNDE